MTFKAILDLISEIIKSLDDFTCSNELRVSGIFISVTEEIIILLQKLHQIQENIKNHDNDSTQIISGISLLTNGKNINLNNLSTETIKLNIAFTVSEKIILNNSTTFIRKDFNEIINKDRKEEKEQYFIVYEKIYIEKGKEYDIQEINNYRNIISLLNLFHSEKISSHKIPFGNNYKLLFISEGKIIELLDQYNRISLTVENDYKKFISFFNDDKFEEKFIILKNSLSSFLNKTDPKQNKLDYIIQNLDELFKDVEMHYTSYINEFASDKIKSEFKNSKIELSKKISNVLSDSFLKVLTIPATLFVFISNFDFKKDSNLIKNIFLSLIVLIATVMFHYILKSQNSVLRILYDEITKLEENESYKKVIKNELATQISDLRDQCKTVNDSFNTLEIINCLIIPFCIFILIYQYHTFGSFIFIISIVGLSLFTLIFLFIRDRKI